MSNKLFAIVAVVWVLFFATILFAIPSRSEEGIIYTKLCDTKEQAMTLKANYEADIQGCTLKAIHGKELRPVHSFVEGSEQKVIMEIEVIPSKQKVYGIKTIAKVVEA